MYTKYIKSSHQNDKQMQLYHGIHTTEKKDTTTLVIMNWSQRVISKNSKLSKNAFHTTPLSILSTYLKNKIIQCGMRVCN